MVEGSSRWRHIAPPMVDSSKGSQALSALQMPVGQPSQFSERNDQRKTLQKGQSAFLSSSLGPAGILGETDLHSRNLTSLVPSRMQTKSP